MIPSNEHISFCAYNLVLSKDRAAAVVTYVTARGIKVNRLQSTGYGVEKLLKDCIDGKKCSEEQHENNRGCAFIIIDQHYIANYLCHKTRTMQVL